MAKMFGKSYTSIGDSSSDLLLKCRGDIKVLWGNKFINLIKDGKINSDSDIKFDTVDNINSVNSNGIYYVEDTGSLVIYISGLLINLTDGSSNLYVSFVTEQSTTSEQKELALINIGFLYKTLEDALTNGISKGIIYVLDTSRLYIVDDSGINAFSVSLPNPITEQVVINRTDSSTGGSLIIEGTGVNNAIAIGTLQIYTNGVNNYINSNGLLYFNINDITKITVDNSSIKIVPEVILNSSLTVNDIQSTNYSDDNGFSLTSGNSGSTLVVDNLTVRNGISNIDKLYPEQYFYLNNIISSVYINESDESSITFYLQLEYENKYETGDIIYTYIPIEDDNYSSLNRIILEVVEESDEEESDEEEFNGVLVKLISSEDNYLEELGSLEDVLNKLIEMRVFLINRSNNTSNLLRLSDNIDLLSFDDYSVESEPESIITRIGNLSEIEKMEIEDNLTMAVEGYGLYSSNSIFKKARYTSEYDLTIDDNSSKFVSTEWVHKLFPQGSIIMFNGTSSNIPEGWAICDGTNGTPDLIGYFIKGDTTAGSVETYEVTSEGQNTTQILTYSLIFIMKIV